MINKNSPAAKISKQRPRQRERRNEAKHHRVWSCNLRQIRDAHGLTMDVVAKYVELSKTAYWQIEHGSDPMLTSARRISDFFGLTIEEIWPSLNDATVLKETSQ
jgi:DNA-binding XRE family transcriptional regulator